MDFYIESWTARLYESYFQSKVDQNFGNNKCLGDIKNQNIFEKSVHWTAVNVIDGKKTEKTNNNISFSFETRLRKLLGLKLT